MDKIWLKFYEKGIPPHIDYAANTLVDFVENAVAEHPDNTAVSYFGKSISYRALGAQINQFAIALTKLGVKAGDRVAIMMPNVPQYVVAHFAALKIGAILVPTNPLYVERELRHQLRDSGAETLITLDILLPKVMAVWKETELRHVIHTKVQKHLPFFLKLLYPVKAARQGKRVRVDRQPGLHDYDDLMSEPYPASSVESRVSPDDVAIFLYTGGTTGVSKGAILTHRNLATNVQQVARWYGEVKHGAEVILCALPFFHSYGLTTCLHMAVFLRSKMVLIPNPRDVVAMLKAIEREKVTLFSGVPTLYVAINNFHGVEKYDLSCIGACLSGGAPLPLKVARQFESLTGARLVEGYGLSETSPVTHANPVTGKRKEGSIGLPLPDTEARIVDPKTKEGLPIGEVGELAVKGPQVMQGYWNMAEETKAVLRDGWLFTGDLAKMDEEGYFYIVDRQKDMIIAGGFNIFPREIEDVLFEHPKILEAAVVGVADEYRGETVKAFIVCKEHVSLTQQEIIDYCKEKLAPFKVPKQIEFIDTLPKSNIGKVLRRELKQSS